MKKILRKHRGVALTGLLLVVAAAASACGYLVLMGNAPNPATASRQAVLRFVVTGELAEQQEAYRVALVDRLMLELTQQPTLANGTADKIPQPYRDNFQQNLNLLKKTWFYSRCERYHELPAAEQAEYLDRQIAAVLMWSKFDLGLADRGEEVSAEERRAAYARQFFGEIGAWVESAPPQQKPLLSSTVQRGLVRWLATRSLTAEPLGTRQALARRIVKELDGGLQLNQVMGSLQEAQQAQLKENGLLLIEAWLHQLAAEYEQLPREQRGEFLEARIEQVTRWDLASLLSAQMSSGSTSSSQTALQLMAVMNQWIERADPATRPQFETFLLDLQRRWIARSLR